MTGAPSCIDCILEPLTPFGEVSPRRKVGGVGLSHDGLMFGMLARARSG